MRRRRRRTDNRLVLPFILAVVIIAAIATTVPETSRGAHQRGFGYRYSAPSVNFPRISKKRPRRQASKSLWERNWLVKKAIDGDTLRLINGERVRLIGVDTPETKHPRKPVQCFGKEAWEFTRRQVEGRYVRLEHDWQLRDKYGRLLAYVYRARDNFFLNYELIRQGYGFAYTRYPFKYMEKFLAAQREARRHGRGLWSKCR